MHINFYINVSLFSPELLPDNTITAACQVVESNQSTLLSFVAINHKLISWAGSGIHFSDSLGLIARRVKSFGAAITYKLNLYVGNIHFLHPSFITQRATGIA